MLIKTTLSCCSMFCAINIELGRYLPKYVMFMFLQLHLCLIKWRISAMPHRHKNNGLLLCYWCFNWRWEWQWNLNCVWKNVVNISDYFYMIKKYVSYFRKLWYFCCYLTLNSENAVWCLPMWLRGNVNLPLVFSFL